MIPIIYEKTETAFISNGLGRLHSCISCLVTEERNGIFECSFEIPMDTDDYKKIQIGRIIGVTHDDSGEIEPFDIVGYERPIDGVVTFHAVHISYRQSYMTITGSNINKLSFALDYISTFATPSNPFTYSTDKTSTGYLNAFDGLPKTVKSILGGMEGSILDTYGGEYEWRKFQVILHERRGQDRDFSIRYGVNMTDYKEELDISGNYSSVVPFWTDGTSKVIGSRVDSGVSTVTGRGETVPLDLSDKFETKPTKTQLETLASSLMNRNNAAVPVQNINVEFVRLQDLPEYAGFGNLLKCQLCDTIRVIFPDYNSSGRFKIVKTVWDVLGDRYESMELGELSTTLSEALGIANGSGSGGAMKEQEVFTGTVGSAMQDGTLVGLYDPNSGIVTIHFACRSTANISTSTALFTIPEKYRPSEAKTIPMMIYTSSAQAGYHGTLSTSGVLTQGWSGSARGAFGSISYKI